MRRWRTCLAIVAIGLLLDGCGVAHERSARSVVADTPVQLAVGSRLTPPRPPLIPIGRSSTISPTVPGRATSSASGPWAWPPGSSASSSPSASPDELVELVSEPIRPFACQRRAVPRVSRPDPARRARGAGSHHDMRYTHSSAPAEEALQHATDALARFRDVAVAQAEGYRHKDGHERSR